MDDQIKQKFIDNLKQNGFSATKTRLIVFGLLVNQEPQGMNDLIKKSRNKVDRVTLYRTIELFEKLNIAEKVYTGWKYKIELSDEYTFITIT
jgi:Fe2+ or Zn2+ uptake regulation protein